MIEVRLREWSTMDPSTASQLASARLDGEPERRLAAELQRAGRLIIEELATGVRVTSTSFVGRLQLGSLVVTIEPKLAKQELLTLVRYAYRLGDVRRLGSAAFATGGSLLPDLLAAQLLDAATDLLARGLPRRYVERAEELAVPRGRIDIPALARRSVPATTLPCRHLPRSANHSLLLVIRGGLELAAGMASDRDLRLGLRRLDARLGTEVARLIPTRALLDRTRRGLTRLEAAAAPILDLIELVLDGQAITLDDEVTLRLPGFLFDMNRFFQALIERWLRDHLPEHEVVSELPLRGLLRYASDANPRGRRAPRPRPDFAVRRPSEPAVLLDAKYRDLWEETLPREMLYQLAMYATSGAGAPTATMLYPTAALAAAEARIEVRDLFTDQQRGAIAVRPVILPRLVELLRAPPGSEARRAEAERMAFGCST